MFLVKFTDPRWKTAALDGTSLRIGSVLHYRSMEGPRVRDETEDEGSVVYKGKTPLDAEPRNRIFRDSGYRLNEGWTIDAGGIPLRGERSTFNPAVVSCSLVRRLADAERWALRARLARNV